jgi:RNA polymerase sigma-70 factor (ECF subfamily)
MKRMAGGTLAQLLGSAMTRMQDDWSGDLLARWRAGDQQAAAEMFRRYADRLIALARSRLSSKLAARVDPEDVVQSAYRSFFSDARDGRYDLQQDGGLWQLLVMITLNKVQHQVERHTSKKRGVDREVASADRVPQLPEALEGREPSPMAALVLTEEVEQLMRPLDAEQRRMLQMRLQGYNLEEIAAAAQCSEATVRRLLERVKRQLKASFADDPAP